MSIVEQHKGLAQEILAESRSQGAEQATLTLATATAFQVEVREANIESLKEAGSSGIHLVLSQDGRRSSLTSNDFRLDTLRTLIRDTLTALPHMDRDEWYTLPEQELQGRAPGDLAFLDPEHEHIASDEKVEDTLRLEELALVQDSRLRTEQSYYSDAISHTVYADSNGFLEGISKTIHSVGVSLVVEDNDASGKNSGRKQTDGWFSCARFRNQLEPLEEIAKVASGRILRKLGAVKPKSCEVPVVFSPEMARSFLGQLSSALLGENVFRQQSFLADKVGQAIANPQVQLSDSPLLPGKLGSRSYDHEGVQSKPLSLIEDGVLCNLMLSTYAANKLGLRSTGHSGGISNLVLQPGAYTEEELIESVEDGLYLTFLSGQGANITTGDYSRGGQGIWIRNGKLAEPVSEFTIASTFLEMLGNLTMLGKEVDTRSAILTPMFRIERMAISGT